ncbi:polyadenylate-binding protein-interacting protein 1 [Orussus abietinus]|uniref:polyadenylate-binding protein-interacting protein 1 n=1 Tax=Orussus abietinus TaxID=222816 RepID=UPI0006254887|nr:polyadenylate-binding protein-interacting protein 1 [Orussus abietinus]XP_012271104.1 polyadenylate-binding protein-interacting protein 1 [Orussus abietinus]
MDSNSAEGSGGGGDGTVDRGRGRGSWNPLNNSGQRFALRRPRNSTSENHGPDSSKPQNKESINEVVKNSRLSADAAEFVPKSQVVQVQPLMQNAPVYVPRPSVQNRLARQPQNDRQDHRQRQTQQQIYGSRQQTHQQYALMQHQQQQHMQYQQYVDTSRYPRYGQRTHEPDYGNSDGGAGDFREQQQVLGSESNDQGTGLTGTIRRLECAMRNLTACPGRFDLLVAPLVDIVSPYLDRQSPCHQIVSAILQQSITEGNFRYSGARLCTHLDTVTSSNDRATSVFRETLYARCHEETESQALAWVQRSEDSEESEKKCHGLILFLAELVAQMESSSALVLGKLLIMLISVVLKRPAPNSAKHICQALKLAGQTLERDSTGSRGEMERVMHALTELVIQGHVDQHVSRMVQGVRELRNCNWGRVVAPHVPVPLDPDRSSNTPQQTDEPVLYGPDGNVLSAEERTFLQENAWEDECREPDLADGDEEGNSDEDAIIAAAYEEFLKLAPNQSDDKVRR